MPPRRASSGSLYRVPVQVREATADDIRALAVLRWSSERPGDADLDRAAFERGFAAWWSQHAGHFRAVVAMDDGQAVGMGFLALVTRVPKPGELDRVHGDIQSMYVAEPHRGCGVGSDIVRSLLDLARDAGCGRVEVHSGRRAVTFYEKVGFEHFRQLMNHPLDH